VKPLFAALILLAGLAPTACTLLLKRNSDGRDGDVEVVDADIDEGRADADVHDGADADGRDDAGDATDDAELDGDADDDGDAPADAEADQDSPEDWFDLHWDYRKLIQFHPTRTPTDLHEFPAAVIINSDDDLAAHADDDWSDLMFVEPDGEMLPFEVERFDGGTGDLVAWVRVPVIDATEGAMVYLYYGSDEDVTHDPSDTWAGRFAGVWHLSVEQDTMATTCPDSTENGDDAAATGTSDGPVGDDGIAGQGLRFDGFQETLSIEDPASGVLDFGTDSFSFSLWVFVTNNGGDFDMPWYKGGSTVGEAGYDMELGYGTWAANLEGNDMAGVFGVNFGSGETFAGEARWIYLAAVVDRTAETFTGYTDGGWADDVDIGYLGSVSNSRRASMGPNPHWFHGVIDEVRVATEALPEGWVATEHENLTELESFLEVGDEEHR